jgi:hypothetical protein
MLSAFELPAVHPAQLLQAIVVRLARHVIQRVPKKMHPAALPCRLEHALDGCLDALMGVGDRQLDAGQAAALMSTPSTSRRPSVLTVTPTDTMRPCWRTLT